MNCGCDIDFVTCMRFNCARSCDDLVGVLEDSSLTLFSLSLVPVCRFRCFEKVRCFALSARCLVVFEENRINVLERRERDLAKWHLILKQPTTWLANDCAVFDDADVVVAVAGSVVGGHVFSLSRSDRTLREERVAASRSISCVHVRKSFLAVAALDGHVAIGRHGAEPPIVWFCENGQRITGIELSSDEMHCAVVCWDGSGALFERQGDDSWFVMRVLHPPALLSSVSRPRMYNPAFGTFCGSVWRILFNGGVKTFDEDGSVQWITKQSDCHTGFCKLDDDTVVVVLENQRLVRVGK
jgi:hypothetical protein